MCRSAFILVAIWASFTNSGARSWAAKTNPKEPTATITSQGRTIQIAQDGAYVNLLIASEAKDDRRVTRVISRPVDQYLLGIVAELRHGETD